MPLRLLFIAGHLEYTEISGLYSILLHFFWGGGLWAEWSRQCLKGGQRHEECLGKKGVGRGWGGGGGHRGQKRNVKTFRGRFR